MNTEEYIQLISEDFAKQVCVEAGRAREFLEYFVAFELARNGIDPNDFECLGSYKG
jgi:hypothetical protein